MNCHNCGRTTFYVVGPDQIPLCIDCNLKHQQVAAIRHGMIADARDDLRSRAAAVTGIPVLDRPRQRLQLLRFGDVILNNLTVQNSAVGLLNTGNIGTVDGAITILGGSGEEGAATALRELKEAIANSDALSVELKNEALELLSVLAAEATVPKKWRRGKAMLVVAERLSTFLQGAAALSDLSMRYMPAILGLFQ